MLSSSVTLVSDALDRKLGVQQKLSVWPCWKRAGQFGGKLIGCNCASRSEGGMEGESVLTERGKVYLLNHYISAAGQGNERCFKVTVTTRPYERPQKQCCIKRNYPQQSQTVLATLRYSSKVKSQVTPALKEFLLYKAVLCLGTMCMLITFYFILSRYNLQISAYLRWKSHLLCCNSGKLAETNSLEKSLNGLSALLCWPKPGQTGVFKVSH